MIRVFPRRQSTSGELQGIDRILLGCLFPEDTDKVESELFQFYSKSSCNVECRLKVISKYHGCSPWDVLPVSESQGRICNGQEAVLFKAAMLGNSTMCDEKCHFTDCEADIYEYSTGKKYI